MINVPLTHSLTQTQTTELRDIWESLKAKLETKEYLFVKVKLGRPEAKLTVNQAYRLMMTLAEQGIDPIPEWLIALFDSPQQEAR
jgi:hypothetical protein